MGTRLDRTFGTATNNKIYTLSTWLKKTRVEQTITILCGGTSARPTPQLVLNSSGELSLTSYNGSNYDVELRLARRFRDTNAWYHIVMAVDTTQATASNRVKFYINGVQETTFTTENYMSQNFVTQMNNNTTHVIAGSTYGGQGGSDANVIYSHYHFIDGTVYDPTAFGETDATTGEWKIKVDPSVTYGNNGFWIFKDGMTITDSSSNSNNWSVGTGTLTKTEDCPSNVFATLNSLDKGRTSNLNLQNGNTTTHQTSNWGDYGIRSTLAATTGKYYWEAKIATSNTLCILPMETRLAINLSDGSPADDLYGVQRYNDSTTNIYDDGTFVQNTSAMWGGITSSDIISFALDLDNGKLFLAKNGAYKNQSGATGDPVNGTNPTFTISDTTKTYGFYTEMRGNDNNGTIMNFGNGYFGTTAVSSAGTNASGNGIFEYDVPTGYTALSTKGLNT